MSASSGTLIGGNLIQPLNHDYIPNIGEVWPTYTNPFYDQQWLYTVPYSIYKTGIGWRKDLVDVDPYTVLNGWEVLWQSKFAGKVAIIDDYREGVSLGLLKTGVTNLNTPDPLQIDDAAHALSDLVKLVTAEAGQQRLHGPGYRLRPGSSTPGQDRSPGRPGSCRRALRSRRSATGSRRTARDRWRTTPWSSCAAPGTRCSRTCSSTSCSSARTRSPTSERPATCSRSSWMTPQRLVSHGVLPESLISTAVLENDFYRGLKELQLTVVADALWQQAWQSVVGKMNLMPPS